MLKNSAAFLSMVIMGGLSVQAVLAQSSPDYSGVYNARVTLTSDSCLNVLPAKQSRALTVTQTAGAISGEEIINSAPVAYQGTLLARGFKLIHAETYPDISRGDCTYTDTFNFRQITLRKAKKVGYIYSEQCVDQGSVTWHCRTTYTGKARRPLLQ